MSCSTVGGQTIINATGLELTLLRVVDPSVHTLGEHALAGTWAGQEQPVLLATARRT